MNQLSTDVPMTIEGQDAYAHLRDGKFVHIHGSRVSVEMCGSGDVIPVRLTPCPEGAYWCWHDFSNNTLTKCWSVRVLLEMCFPQGIEFCEERGEGLALRVRVEPRLGERRVGNQP